MSLLASTASKLSPKNIKSSVGAVGTELGHLAAATGHLLIPGSAWNDKIKAKAVFEIELLILEHEAKRDEMERLIEHTTEFVAARLEAENQIGAVLSMKQVLKYESLREQATRAIAALQETARQVQTSPTFIDYQAKINKIVQVPAPTCSLNDDREQVLAEARKRLRPVQANDLHKAGAYAA